MVSLSLLVEWERLPPLLMAESCLLGLCMNQVVVLSSLLVPSLEQDLCGFMFTFPHPLERS
jgi:hypothetical protein